MAFRQFPATTDDGESWIVIEFKDESGGAAHSTRYELSDGRPLVREGSRLSTSDGEINLSLTQPYRA